MIKHLFIFIFIIPTCLFSQEKDSLQVSIDSVAVQKNHKKEARIAKREARRLKNLKPYDALAPTRASFYSAILPGLGQAYTGKYWKIPIVYGALGTSIGIALWNQRQIDDFRGIYRNRLVGINNDRFIDPVTNEVNLDNETLVSVQEGHQKQKEISILVTVGIYVLNIIDANVTAHLQQFNLNKELSLQPNVEFDNLNRPNYGLSLSYNFK